MVRNLSLVGEREREGDGKRRERKGEGGREGEEK